ncbi:hypothetical protein K470DRAFT_269142 [Piedraia hortae CBS 480.64]|uniref:Uncharacterized protein n=1 Tax=Piedraia hortae CBS 480.64 TaxID=1314780 RepID=A0A6A7C529_9PEZI|nr:hypothetical protein K470DRAFT_269142 [Piedraia hortae CBS 480.64]
MSSSAKTSGGKRKREQPARSEANTANTSTFSARQQNDLLLALKLNAAFERHLNHEFDESSAAEPTAKKVKLNKGQKTSIAERLEQGAYGSVDALQQDVARVADGQPADNFKGFQQAIKELTGGNRTCKVLTLYGNATGAKQLYSSVQRNGTGVNGTLPPGVVTTTIQVTAGADRSAAPTFEQAFPAPYAAPSLQPPKPQRRSARSTDITWEFKNTYSPNSLCYTTQSLTKGDWLGYGGAKPTAKDRRRQRDRALSGGDSKEDKSLDLVKQEEALFRRAYSSFAPSYDDARAVIPAQTKANIWWQRVGERRFDEVFGMTKQPTLPPERETTDAELKEAIEGALATSWESSESSESPEPEFTVPRILDRVTDLLKTLASYQRIRSVSRVSTGRTPASPLTPQTPTDTPGSEEVSTYESLRRELTHLILRLPPYAVAKLNGQQLNDLGVSRILRLEAENLKGTMDEDQAARTAKFNAAQAAAGIASLRNSNQHYNSTAQRTPAIGSAANTRYASNGAGFHQTPSRHTGYGTPGVQGSYSTMQYTRQVNPVNGGQQRFAAATRAVQPSPVRGRSNGVGSPMR